MIQEEEILALLEENARLRQSLQERDNYIHRTFGRYLTNEVLEQILSGREGGERRVISIMFADLRSSTAMSEEMDPDDFIRMLNHFFSEMIEIINAWQGNILEFVGDEIVTAFGAPRPSEYSARDACGCAVAMQRRMPAVNAWNREQGYPEISMGIGMHTGEAIVGNIGSETRMKYDMIGRNVNLASRVQNYTKGGQILVTEELLSDAGDQVQINREGSLWVRPKGIQADIQLYDVVGFGKQRIPEAEDGR